MSKKRDSGEGVSRRKFITAGAAASAYTVLPSSFTAAKRSRSVSIAKFDIERFVEECVSANQESDPQAAVLEVLAKAVDTPASVIEALGEPTEAGIRVLHRSENLTIFSATWTPQMNLMPHNHLMWANIGIYTGREDNILWRKESDRIDAFGAKALFERDVAALPVTAIHSVTNPLPRFTGGIHIYGGDFFNTTRTQWDPESLDEEPSDGAVIREIFERENERMRRNRPL